MVTQSLDISSALRLDKQSVNALLQGKAIASIPRTFTIVGRAFALYPDQSDGETVTISAWARCEQCDIVDNSKPLEIISHYTDVPPERLQKMIAERESFFLIYLRVYRLHKPITIPAKTQGQYIALPDRIKVDESLPVLSDRDFARLKQQLENLEPPEPLDVQIQRVLEEVELQLKVKSLKKLDWIKKITTLGNRSIELEEKKTTYQAGTDFENIVKRGLEFLGFTIDYSHKGGAGGLDLRCSHPYLLIGECKAGKSIPKDTVQQLMRLGDIRLETPQQFEDSVKLIISSGKPASNDVITSAHKRKISIVNPMTLQKLVELKAKYDGAINLFELKEYLQAGQIDEEIDKYIQKVENEIKLRSHVVCLVKNHHEDRISVEGLFNVYPYSDPPQPTPKIEDLRDILRDILIELSSPLAGYLGRVEEGGKKCDRFYFLRDLPIEKEA